MPFCYVVLEGNLINALFIKLVGMVLRVGGSLGT